MPPANNSFSTAIEITAFPYDFTQTDINDSGINYTVYYKFVAPPNSRAIGSWGFSGNIGSGYRPGYAVYLGPAGSPTLLFGGSSFSDLNRPVQFVVTPGLEYFLVFLTNTNTAGPEDLRVRVEVHNPQITVGGSILINDDTEGFPLVSLSHTQDNTVLNFFPNVVSGEAGDIFHTTSNITLLENIINTGSDRVKRYDPSFNFLSDIASINNGSMRLRINHIVGKCYYSCAGQAAVVNAQFRTITESGTLGSIVTLPDVGCTSLCCNNDESILYYTGAGGSVGTPVKRWNILGGSALTDLAAGVTDYQNGDTLVLADGTILVSYFKSTPTRDLFVRRYDSAGSILNTYNFGTDHTSTLPRMTWALDNPNSFWIWTHPAIDIGASVFLNVRVNDGTILTTRTHTEFVRGVYARPETATPVSRFGNADSCPMLIYGGATYNGIYIIVPGKTDDTVKFLASTILLKIPDPTFKTGLLG